MKSIGSITFLIAAGLVLAGGLACQAPATKPGASPEPARTSAQGVAQPGWVERSWAF